MEKTSVYKTNEGEIEAAERARRSKLVVVES
jgi:hypothetical protein